MEQILNKVVIIHHINNLIMNNLIKMSRYKILMYINHKVKIITLKYLQKMVIHNNKLFTIILTSFIKIKKYLQQ